MSKFMWGNLESLQLAKVLKLNTWGELFEEGLGRNFEPRQILKLGANLARHKFIL
jgi:hypothetical protein